MGWEFTWLVLFIPFSYWFMAAVLAPRFARTREMTLPAFIERRYYSRRARALAAVVILIATTVYIQAQVIAGGLIAETVFGIPAVRGMVFFTAILLAYTAVGGMVAVVYTDLLQLVVMVVGALVAAPMVFRLLDGPGPLFAAVEALRPEAFTLRVAPRGAAAHHGHLVPARRRGDPGEAGAPLRHAGPAGNAARTLPRP